MAAPNGQKARKPERDERGGDLSVRGEESESPGVGCASLRGRPKERAGTVLWVICGKYREQP